METQKWLSPGWVIDNLISELLFGVLLLGIIAFLWRYFRDAWRAFKVFRIISTHNNPTRTRRKGIHALDRFMDIFESNTSLSSRSCAYNTGFIEGVFNEQYLDQGILELHKLVSVQETPRGMMVKANRDRVTRWVYWIARWATEKEKSKTEAFVLDKSGKKRKLVN